MYTWRISGKALFTGALTCTTIVAASLVAPQATRSASTGPSSFVDVPNGEGISRTLTTARSFDTTNPFFQPLGANGRTCATCHPVDQGMIVSPDYAMEVFNATQGLDPLFAPVDGANSPMADMSTPAAR